MVHDWWYECFKDFAGPIATMIAAGVAAFFVSRQAQIADQQARTALDQLRYNLFEKRLAIYEDIKDFIRTVLSKPLGENFGPHDLIPHYLIMEEAIRFFFPEDIRRWTEELRKDCEKFFQARERALANPDEYRKQQERLLGHLTGMPERFQRELGFRQLTQPASR